MSGDSVCMREHALYCFDTLNAKLTGELALPPEFPEASFPLFVSWHTIRNGYEPRLRGCIGNFGAMPLASGLAQYALISAFEDHRFDPIRTSEFPSLECEVSLLSDFEDAKDYLDWEIGTHGIYITFSPPGHSRSLTATYLPHIAPEQGWSKQEAIDSAIRKAGYRGTITDSFRNSLNVERYQSRIVSVTWAEYREWKEARTE